MTLSTPLAALKDYQATVAPQVFAMTRTALFRFTLPGWNRIYFARKRLTAQELEICQQNLASITMLQLVDALTIQEQVFTHLNTPAPSRRVHRMYLKQFIDWCHQQGYFTSVGGEQTSATHLDGDRSSSSGIQIYQLQSPHGTRQTYANDLRLTDKPKKATYALTCIPGDFINLTLHRQVQDWQRFMQTRLTLARATQENYESTLMQILGWVHRYQGIALEQLTLHDLISVPTISQGMQPSNTQGLMGLQAEEMALAMAQQNCEQIQRYLIFINSSFSRQLKVLQACVTIAKFLYASLTQQPFDYRDVVVIQRLRQMMTPLRQQAKHAPRTIPFEKKSIPWPGVYRVLMQLKKEADITLIHQQMAECRNGIYSVSRKPSGIARSYQKFLILGLLVLMPPDRPRTIRELQVGRTLVQGQMQGGVFVPVERLSMEESAQWYLHLLPSDYKTGTAYGEYWAEIPNPVFGDGSFFYDYLNRWIGEYRNCFQPQHPYCFTKYNGKPLVRASLNNMMRAFFFRIVGVPVSPKELRPMYVTYLRDQGVSEAELEAAACAMHHSRRMQAKVYDRQQVLEKQHPIHDFNQQLIRHIEQEVREHDA